MERLGNQEGRLWSFTSQKAFRIGRDENDRHFERSQHFIHCIQTGTAIRKLYIGKNDPGPLSLGKRYRFSMRARNAKHSVAKAFHQSFEIERDEGFILYNENVSGDLSCELAAGFLDKIAQGRSVNIQNLGSIIFGQAFESDQQEGLARFWRDLSEMTLNRLARPSTG